MNTSIFFFTLAFLLTLPSARGQQVLCTSTVKEECEASAQAGPLPDPLKAIIQQETSVSLCQYLSACTPSSRLPTAVRPGYVQPSYDQKCHRMVNCRKPRRVDLCEDDFGSTINVNVTWLSLLSSKTRGAASGVWSSGISRTPNNMSTTPYRFLLNAESNTSKGITNFALFRGSPGSTPITAILTLSPGIKVPATGPATFKFSQFVFLRDDVTCLPLQTLLMKKGKFGNGKCDFDSGAPFSELVGENFKTILTNTISALHGRLTLKFGMEVEANEITVTVNKNECVNIITSTGKPCCSINPNIAILLPTMDPNCQIPEISFAP